jgi:tetratricopeptide (TPR) repeat protein
VNTAKDIFQRAEQAARKGNLEYSIELYLQGLTVNPAASDERQTLHRIEAQLVENNGGNPAGGVGAKLKSAGKLANLKKLKIQKKWDEAILEIENILKIQPHNTHLLFDLAEMLENIEARQSAIAILSDLTDIDKTHVESYRKLGSLWREEGEPKKAIEAWEKLKMYRPEDKEAGKAIRDLAAATMVNAVEEKKSETGDTSFRSMLKSEEESADLEQKAKVLRTDEDRVEAIRFKKEDLRSDPTNSRLWRELGALYQDLRKWKHAKAAYKKALEVNPQDLFAIDRIGTLQESILDEGVAALKKQMSELEESAGSEDELASVQVKLEEAETNAVEFKTGEYERKVLAHPTDYELKLVYGELLMQGGSYDQGIEQFQKAVKDPKFKVRAQNNMGKCFQKKNVHAIAITQYQEALKGVADPDSDIAKDIRYNLATAAEDNGEYDEALAQYQIIMATDIGFRDVSGRVDSLMQKKTVE